MQPATQGRDQRLQKGRAQRPTWMVVACIAPLAFVVLMTLIAGDSPPTPAMQAQDACSEVVEAGRDAAAGKRSQSSYLSIVRSAEEEARAAATRDRRYRPILEAIQAMRTDTRSGRGEGSAAASFLAARCG